MVRGIRSKESKREKEREIERGGERERKKNIEGLSRYSFDDVFSFLHISYCKNLVLITLRNI